MEYALTKKWNVVLTTRAEKQSYKLSEKIQSIFIALLKDLEELGAYQADWPNYRPLNKDKNIPENSHHCHLKKGKPTYVACWNVDKKNKLIEVFYVGTHENAPYKS